VHKSGAKNLPEKVKKILAEKYDLKNFSFLFARPSPKNEIAGKIFDRWEFFPNWYQKMRVEVENPRGEKIGAQI